MLARKSAILQIYPSYSVVQKFAIIKRNQTLIEVREKLRLIKKSLDGAKKDDIDFL